MADYVPATISNLWSANYHSGAIGINLLPPLTTMMNIVYLKMKKQKTWMIVHPLFC